MGEGGSLGGPTASWFLGAKEKVPTQAASLSTLYSTCCGAVAPHQKTGWEKREEVPPSRHLALAGFGTSSSDFLWAAGRETGACTGATERKDKRQLMLPRSRFSLRAA